MECKHLDTTGDCLLISQIVGEPYVPSQEECRACSRCKPPQEINDLTVLVSNRILEELDKPTLYKGAGPGTRLAKTIAWFSKIPPDCDCADRAAIMDAWGVEGCKRNKRIIVHWLEESAHMIGMRVSRLTIEALVTVLLATPYNQTKFPQEKTQKYF